ncbi:MAG: hypothetical protein EYC70_12385 [Planctomycetota bacterium]|nr:MAG: hypothetical protein EYC70_12385 [Planctomycetota bacterium]
MAAEPLSRGQWQALPRALLSRGSRLKPAVWKVETPSGAVIVKDAAGAPTWSRWLARWLLARERRVLERLHGVAGVPELLACLDRGAFACTLLQGRPLEREAFARQPRAVVERLLALIERLHDRGVFHLDLRQRQNVLVDETGAVAVVDFGAAWRLGAGTRWLLGGPLGWVDRQAALKYLARYAPEELSPEEARAVLRAERWRRLWPFTPHRSRGESEAARKRLREISGR